MTKKKNADKTPATPATADAAKSPDPVVDDAAGDPVVDSDAEDQAELDGLDQADAGTDPVEEIVDEIEAEAGTDDDAAPAILKSEPVTEGKAAGPADKKAADKARRQTAIDEHQEAIAKAPVNEELQKADAVKDDIRDRMDEIAAEVAEHDEAINVLRDESAELLLELYPQQGANDKHSVAVRGYLNASARERQHRKIAPARLKSLLEKAGLAPIDAAFSRARGRGMARPIRKAAKKATKKAE